MTQKQRPVERHYDDPVDLIWLHLADRIGFRIERDDEVFAAWDGAGTLRIGTESLDADDSLAQMVLHELCHFFVEGPDSWSKPDWDLNGENLKDRSHEFATLRLQASLADKVSMRRFFAATTIFREYYDALPPDLTAALPGLEMATKMKSREFGTIKPVTRDEDQRAIDLFLLAQTRFATTEWSAHLWEALHSTRQVFLVVRDLAPPDSSWADSV